MLSAESQALFRLFIERHGDFAMNDANHEAKRELPREGLMIPGHSFTVAANPSTRSPMSASVSRRR
jgi:hypothetical protein